MNIAVEQYSTIKTQGGHYFIVTDMVTGRSVSVPVTRGIGKGAKSITEATDEGIRILKARSKK